MSQGSNMSLRLMLHKDTNRVIYAEADHHFIDTLFSFMTLPLGTIIRLLAKRPDEKVKPLGSLQNLYQSLFDLSENYFTTKGSKFMMLNPTSSLYDHCRKLKVNVDDTKPIKYFVCEGMDSYFKPSCSFFSTCNSVKCTCGKMMDKNIKYDVSTTTNENGVFVFEVAVFIITDSLCVMPNTSGTSIQVLRDCGITDAGQLEERTIDIGYEEVLILLKGALLFKNPLTYLAFYNTHLIQNVVILPRNRYLNQQLTSDKLAPVSTKMKVKVTLQKSNSKLLFVETEIDFVEFLFGFFEIPLGAMIGKLMNGSSSLEAMDNLFASISNMNVGYIMWQDLKDMLLEPKLAWNSVSQNHMFSLNIYNTQKIYAYRGYNTKKTTYDSACFDLVNVECKALTYKNPSDEGKLLKAPARFMLTDDLVLTPMSSFSTIAMLNKLKVPLNDVVEHEVSIGTHEGVQILKGSLKSLSVMTDALLERTYQDYEVQYTS